MPDLLSGYPVIIRLPLQWGEMDAYQHLNNVAYFRYFESGRIAYFRAMDLGDDSARVRPILASISCRYKAPLHYPDTLSVGSRVTEMGADRFTMEHVLVSEQLGRVAAESQGLLVSYDYDAGAKTALPDAWRAAVARLQGSAA